MPTGRSFWARPKKNLHLACIKVDFSVKHITLNRTQSMLATPIMGSIVTHNIKDFRRTPEMKVQAITPADFLRLLRTSP
jgi:hypothetical protein